MRSFTTPILIACLTPTAVVAQTASERASAADKVFAELKGADAKARADANAALARFGPAGSVMVRRELRKAEAGDFRATLSKTLVEEQASVWRRNVRRTEGWSDAGRIDLLTELLSTNPKQDVADALTPLVGLRQELATQFAKLRATADYPNVRLPPTGVDSPANVLQLLTTGLRNQPVVKLVGRPSTALTGAVVFAEHCSIKYKERDGCFLAIRSKFEDAIPKNEVSEWLASTILVNASFQAREMSGCLVVCDGDFAFTSENVHKIHGSLVICNGNFVADAKLSAQAVSNSIVYATGDIDLLPGVRRPSNSLFYAGGKLKHATAAVNLTQEKVTEPPFNVRFLDPKEFGVTLEPAKGGLAVAKLDDKSPFAVQGLKVGDLITHADDDPMPTVAAFRRELRRGVIDGGLLVRVERDKKVIPMLFEIPDVPKPAKK